MFVWGLCPIDLYMFVQDMFVWLLCPLDLYMVVQAGAIVFIALDQLMIIASRLVLSG